MAQNFLVVSPVHIAVYTNGIWEKQEYKDPKTKKPKGKAKYQYIALFGADADISDMKKKAVEAAKAEFGANVDLKTVQFPFKNGDKEADRILAKAAETAKNRGEEPKKTEKDVAFYRGNIVMKTTSEYPPKVVDNKGDDILDHDKIYGGVKVRTEFNFRATEIDQDGTIKRYVSAYFNFVMKTGDGPKIMTGGRSAKQVFKGLLGESTTEDPTADSGSDIDIE
jgi:hypothetical protein